MPPPRPAAARAPAAADEHAAIALAYANAGVRARRSRVHVARRHLSPYEKVPMAPWRHPARKSAERMSDHTAELARLLRAATPSPAAATPNDQSVGPSLELPADLLADRAALPLMRAIRLRPEQAGAEYGALARLAADRSEDLPTQLSLLRAATALLPRDADLAFRLANKEMEDFDNLFRAEGLRPGESEQASRTPRNARTPHDAVPGRAEPQHGTPSMARLAADSRDRSRRRPRLAHGAAQPEHCCPRIASVSDH